MNAALVPPAPFSGKRRAFALAAVVALFSAPQVSGPPDWIELGDRVYATETPSGTSAPVVLAEEIARVQRPWNTGGLCSRTDMYYRLKVGTPIHRIVGHDPRTLVAVPPDGTFGVRIYGVVKAPDARRAADLIDLSIGLERIWLERKNVSLGEITGREILDRIAREMAEAPLASGPSSDGKSANVSFVTRDRVVLTRSYRTGYLSPGIAPPPALTAVLEDALRNAPSSP
jgi:hypothetical protein